MGLHPEGLTGDRQTDITISVVIFKVLAVHQNIQSSWTQHVSHVRLALQEAETHAERLQRLRKSAAPTDLSGLSASQKRKVMRKLKAEQRRKAALHRPGKRQRAEMKAEVFNTATAGSAKETTPVGKGKRSQATRGKRSQETLSQKDKVQKAGISKKSPKSKG